MKAPLRELLFQAVEREGVDGGHDGRSIALTTAAGVLAEEHIQMPWAQSTRSRGIQAHRAP